MHGINIQEWRKLQCVIGGLCAMCISGQLFIIGNLATYMESYLRERGDFPPEATWFVSSLLACTFVGALLGVGVGGYLDRAIGSHLTALIGLGCLIVGTASSCWSLRVSTVAVIATFGVLPGVGLGCVYGTPYSALNKHRLQRPGLVFGIVNAGFGGGAVIFNCILSAFINPENQAPDKQHAHGRTFSQNDILDNTPLSFLLLSGIYTVLLPVAVVGMRPPPPASDAEVTLTLTADSVLSSEKSSLRGENLPQSNEKCRNGNYLATRPSVEAREGVKKKEGDGGRKGGVGRGVSPRHIFRYRAFYVLWVAAFLQSGCNNAVIGYYKELGLTHITDDILLASMGTVGSLLSAVGRPLWGLLVDYTSFKTVTVLQGGLTCIFLAFWELALLHSRWLYYIWTVTLFALVSAVSMFCVLACKAYFGQDHFVANLAVLWTALSLQSLLLPFVTSAVLNHSDWNTLLMLLALGGFLSMLVCLLLPADFGLVSDKEKGNEVKVNGCQPGSGKD